MLDALNRLLAELPSAEPDQARAARTRDRCRAHLERRTRPRPPLETRPGSMALIWQPVAAVLAVAYLTEAIVEALRFVSPFAD